MRGTPPVKCSAFHHAPVTGFIFKFTHLPFFNPCLPIVHFAKAARVIFSNSKSNHAALRLKACGSKPTSQSSRPPPPVFPLPETLFPQTSPGLCPSAKAASSELRFCPLICRANLAPKPGSHPLDPNPVEFPLWLSSLSEFRLLTHCPPR